MKHGEKGFTLIELVVALAIIVLTSGAAAAATFQVFKGTKRSNDYLTVTRQVQNASHWISHDTQTAQTVTADNLTSPNFLILNWTEWDEDDNPIYHSATYFFEDMTDGIGKLKRLHWSSAGANEQALIAEYIYYDPGNPAKTSKVNYQNPLLTVQLTAIFAELIETREYRVNNRPNL